MSLVVVHGSDGNRCCCQGSTVCFECFRSARERSSLEPNGVAAVGPVLSAFAKSGRFATRRFSAARRSACRRTDPADRRSSKSGGWSDRPLVARRPDYSERQLAHRRAILAHLRGKVAVTNPGP
jgi:hypothetical protein